MSDCSSVSARARLFQPGHGETDGRLLVRKPAATATGRRFASPAVRISRRYERVGPSWWILNQTALGSVASGGTVPNARTYRRGAFAADGDSQSGLPAGDQLTFERHVKTVDTRLAQRPRQHWRSVVAGDGQIGAKVSSSLPAGTKSANTR